MTSLRNSSSTSAFLQELALNLRSRSASSCSASGVLQMNPTWCKNQQEVGEDGESMLLPDVLSKQGTQALSQQDRAVDSAFTWSSGLTPLIQATGELNPYDLRNAILPTWNPASKQQPLSPVATDVGLTGRFRDGGEGWFPSEERMSSLTQGVSSGIFSRSLDFEEKTREASYDTGYKSPMNASRRFSFQDEKGTKQLLRGGVPQASYGTSRTVAETTTVLSTVKGEAAVAGELATQPAKLSSVPLKVQSSAASIQSSNILTFHNNMSKISVPLTNTSLQQTTVTAERHNYTGSSQELEQQDGTTVKRIFERADAEVISEHKRCSSTVSDGEDGATSELIKRSKVADPAPTASTKFQSSSQTQVRKEKLGERITALQQLVSPFGKTDTASVLLEAIGYIKFLQEQVQVLSSPYMKPAMGRQDTGNISSSNSSESPPDLRSRGLCLVPVSCTLNVANSNGADYWTSGISGGSRY